MFFLDTGLVDDSRVSDDVNGLVCVLVQVKVPLQRQNHVFSDDGILLQEQNGHIMMLTLATEVGVRHHVPHDWNVDTCKSHLRKEKYGNRVAWKG